MTRRTFLAAPIAALAQQTGSNIQTIWGRERSVPEEFARESVVFPRAYSCCPRRGVAQRATLTSRFPHAARPEDSTIPSLLETTGFQQPVTVYLAECGDDEESPFEHSVRIPLAIRWPGVLKPRIADEILISQVDIAPTLLGLAGAVVPEGFQGRDLSALLRGRKAALPDSVFAEGKLGQASEWRTVIRGYEKIVVNRDGEPTHLFNLAEDAGESVNLINSGDHTLTRDAMLALMRVWRRKLADGVDPSGLRLR